MLQQFRKQKKGQWMLGVSTNHCLLRHILGKSLNRAISARDQGQGRGKAREGNGDRRPQMEEVVRAQVRE